MSRARDREDYREEGPPYPVVVMIAGIAWIGFGALIVVSSLLVLAIMVAATGRGPDQGALVGVAGCMALFSGLIAAAFIFVGVQSVRGTAPGTLGNGIGSILFGLINLIPLVVRGGGANYWLQVILAIFSAFGLIGAGVLALVGTNDYQAWRQFFRPVRRRRSYRDEEDYQDDRPPRRRRRDEEDYEDRPRRRPRREEDDYEEEPPRRRRREEGDYEDDRPRRRPPPEDDDEGRYRPR